MMIDWNAYQAQILTTLAQLGRLTPDTLRGYRTLSDANER